VRCQAPWKRTADSSIFDPQAGQLPSWSPPPQEPAPVDGMPVASSPLTCGAIFNWR
jgi:hypothetical protein